jgi:hypothetical protein
VIEVFEFFARRNPTGGGMKIPGPGKNSWQIFAALPKEV